MIGQKKTFELLKYKRKTKENLRVGFVYPAERYLFITVSLRLSDRLKRANVLELESL